MPQPTPPSHDPARGRGLAAVFGAYGIWGLFPIYFNALAPSGAWEILAHRIVWTLVTCAIVLAWWRDLAWVPALLRRPRLASGVALAAFVIAVNWGVYVWAVRAGRTSEAALGYFLNPLVTVAMGVVLLREHLRPLQWAAVGVGVVAAAYLALAAGGMPWVSLVLALSFAVYGFMKKKVGGALGPWHSLAGETAVLAPLAVAVLLVLDHQGQTTFAGHGGGHTALLVASGVITAVPLLLFAAAAQRIPLVLIGLVQFMTPVMQLLVAVLVEHEHLTRERWTGFAIVWVALVLLTVDSLRALRTGRPAPVVEPVDTL